MSDGQPFSCPACGSPLVRARDGGLSCSAGHSYPVVHGIPRFVAEETYAASFGRQWNQWATTQMDSVNGTTIFRDRFSRYFTPPERLAGMRVLDAGCGVGAFVDIVAPHAALVLGIDLSSSVEAAQRNVGGLGNVRIAQADIFAPPFRPESFDFVYCVGVLQHTPDPERAFASLARLVRPGGQLGAWVYERSRLEPLKPRHLLRHYTTRLEPARAMRFVAHYAPRALRIRRAAARLPGATGVRKLVPVADIADYEGDPSAQLSPEQTAEWCVMDTHDMLVTTYDAPQRPEEVARWYRDNGFEQPRRAAAEAVAMIGAKRC